MTPMPGPSLRRPFPVFVLAAAAATAGVSGFTASTGLRDDMAIATFVAIVAAAMTALALLRWPGFAALVVRPSAIARTLFVVGSLAVGVQLAWLTPFIIDPSRPTWTPGPLAPLPSVHSCVSAYWVASTKVLEIPDVYQKTLYELPQADPKARRAARTLGPLQVDNYEYPPTFLLLPRLLSLAAPDFWSFRRLWFALNLTVVVIGAVAVAKRLDDRLGTQSLWLMPFVIAGPATMATFQVGNVQLAMIAITALAMWAFDRRAPVLGGALLAFATAGKLYPGVFVLYLLLRRDWKALAWTAAFGALLVGASLADVGWQPYRAFLHEMPGLMSGEAFSAFRNPAAIGNNGSVPGLVFKLAIWGVPNMGFPAMRLLGWAYTLVVVAGTAWLAFRARHDGCEPVVWMMIVVLATMRSPFMATYAFFPVMWLATLVLALRWAQGGPAFPAMLCWILLAITFGPMAIEPRWNAAWTSAQTLLSFALVYIAMRYVSEPRAVPEAMRADRGRDSGLGSSTVSSTRV